MITQNITNVEMWIRKYKNITEKFTQNETLTKEEIVFLINFRRELNADYSYKS